MGSSSLDVVVCNGEDLRQCHDILFGKCNSVMDCVNMRAGGRPSKPNGEIVGGNSKTVVMDGNSLTLEQVMMLGDSDSRIEVHPAAMTRLQEARVVIDNFLKSKGVVYAINTGFGRLSTEVIDEGSLEQLQTNLIRSHSTGVGAVVPLDVSRRIMALRINTLLKGCSGVSESTFDMVLKFFNSGLSPYIREQGSVGASGDLVPLAHIALNVIGEGQIWHPKQNKYVDVKESGILQEYGLEPVSLKAKDGLAMINGTQFICGIGAEALRKAINAVRLGHVVAAMTLTALNGHPEAYDSQIHAVRPHPGQICSAALMRELVPVGTNEANQIDVQDAYSLRCLPQVHGCVLQAIQRALVDFEIEINSATDNPLIFGDTQRMVSGGNFHAEYVAKSFDSLAMYVHELANISYARLMRMMNPDKNNKHLPAFVVPSAGLSSGMMTWENVSASLVSENKVLCHPSSVDSLSTCADKEDHVSMGGMSARKAVKVVDNVLRTLTIELMAATQALQHMERKSEKEGKTFKMSPLVKKVLAHTSKQCPYLETDEYTVPKYDKLLEAVNSGEIFDVVADTVQRGGKQEKRSCDVLNGSTVPTPFS